MCQFNTDSPVDVLSHMHTFSRVTQCLVPDVSHTMHSPLELKWITCINLVATRLFSNGESDALFESVQSLELAHVVHEQLRSMQCLHVDRDMLHEL